MRTRFFGTVFCVLLGVLLACMLAAGLLAPKAMAGWGPGGCAPVGRVSVASPAPVRQGWEFSRGCWYFYCAGIQVAGYDPQDKIYRTYDSAADTWSDPKPAPWEPAQADKP